MPPGCGIEEFVREVEGLGVGVEWVEPEGPVPGEKWWRRPLDAWPLLQLAVLTGKARPPGAYVIRPGGPEEVARVLDAAAERGVCVVPRGGGSGVLGAASPRDCCVVLDLGLLRGVEWLGDGIAYALAGTALIEIDEAARERGYMLPLEPQSIRHATIGGMVSTLGSGALQPGIGNVEDVVQFLDVAVPGRGVVRLGSPRAPRGVSPGGPQMVLGHEGLLGVVVGVGLRLRRIPAHVASATFRFPSFHSALRAAEELVHWNQPAVLRVIDEEEARILHGEEGHLLIVAYVDDTDPAIPSALLGKARSAAGRHDGSPAPDLYEKWRESRYGYGSMLRGLAEAGLWFDTIDMQAPWSALPGLRARLHESLRGVEGVHMVFSHASHFYTTGGSLYTTLVLEARVEALAEAWRRALRAAWEAGAWPAHHHGIGLQRLQAAALMEGNLHVLCAAKKGLDPARVLQPHGLASLCRVRGLG